MIGPAAVLLAALAAPAPEGASPAPTLHIAAAPARPGWVAEREELDAARASGRADRLRLFLARHPKSRFAPEARRALRRLAP